MEKKYTIGLDFGTLSGRGVVVSCEDGSIIASAVKEYSHGVMDRVLCDGGEPLPEGWALQHPGDYIEVLETVIPAIVEQSQLKPSAIIGIGIDFTSCTMLPIDGDGMPLCMKQEYKGRRNAYAKLWKHHGAQRFADKINSRLEERGLSSLPRFGGKVSSELMLPKAMETLFEDPELYASAAEMLEAGDWLTRVLTGSTSRSCSMAGYKAWWSSDDGYPDSSFFAALDPRLASFAEQKLRGAVVPMGQRIGALSALWAEKLGLAAGTAVAPTIIDSHAGVPGSGVADKGQMMLVLGTSGVMIALSESPYSGLGIMGGVRDAVVPGCYALESGLASVGDLFRWFAENCVPYSYHLEAEEAGIDIHQLLSRKASKLQPGSHGLLALDWWNGNKTPFVDGELRGALLGMSLGTKPEEIYRALIESTAFGTRRILELYEQNGSSVQEIVCSGGISLKNPLLMQIYADVLGKRLRVAASDQAAALGSAIYAALAAGSGSGGYDDYSEAVGAMCSIGDTVYLPDAERHGAYSELYRVYKDCGEIMGRAHRDILSRLRTLGSR